MMRRVCHRMSCSSSVRIAVLSSQQCLIICSI